MVRNVLAPLTFAEIYRDVMDSVGMDDSEVIDAMKRAEVANLARSMHKLYTNAYIAATCTRVESQVVVPLL